MKIKVHLSIVLSTFIVLTGCYSRTVEKTKVEPEHTVVVHDHTAPVIERESEVTVDPYTGEKKRVTVIDKHY